MLFAFCGGKKILFPVDNLRFLFHRKLYNPRSYSAPLYHLTSCTPNKSNIYFANSMATVESDLDLYRFLTFQVPDLMYLLHCLGCTKGSFQAKRTIVLFIARPVFFGNELSASRPISKLEDHPLPVVLYCVINIFAAALHIAGRSPYHQ